MADKILYIPNDDTQNEPAFRLQLVFETCLPTELNKPTNQTQLKNPRLLSQRIRKLYYKTLGTG